MAYIIFETCLRLEVWTHSMGPILGTLEGTLRVYSRYVRIRGFRAHTRGCMPKKTLNPKPWFQPSKLAMPGSFSLDGHSSKRRSLRPHTIFRLLEILSPMNPKPYKAL